MILTQLITYCYAFNTVSVSSANQPTKQRSWREFFGMERLPRQWQCYSTDLWYSRKVIIWLLLWQTAAQITVLREANFLVANCFDVLIFISWNSITHSVTKHMSPFVWNNHPPWLVACEHMTIHLQEQEYKIYIQRSQSTHSFAYVYSILSIFNLTFLKTYKNFWKISYLT